MAENSIKRTLREYGRGVIGGFLFSLPLIYTMEVWWAGFIAPASYLLSCIAVTFLLLLGYNRFAGMRSDSSFLEVLWDSVEEIGMALVVSFLFLLLISQVDFQMSFNEIAGKVILETLFIAIGISVGKAQLGGKEDKEEEDDSGMDQKEKDKPNGLLKLVILAVCGSVLFASSVAPTEEILMLGVQSEPVHLLLMIFLSIGLSMVVLYFSNFRGTGERPAPLQMALQLMVSYLIALLVSLSFLWFFGRVEGNSLSVIISQVIVLGIPASIGASAGRLLIEG